jgi:hypothetical protein
MTQCCGDTVESSRRIVLRASVPMATCAHNGNSDFLSGPLMANSFVAKD